MWQSIFEIILSLIGIILLIWMFINERKKSKTISDNDGVFIGGDGSDHGHHSGGHDVGGGDCGGQGGGH
jgi:hypothetical protein